MTLDLLNQWGLTGFDYSYVFIGIAGGFLVLLIIIIIQTVQISKLKKKYKKFMTGKDARTLENSIEKLFEDNQYFKDISEENRKEIRRINKEMTYSFNKVGIVKYDAFQQMGGKLSFSIALINERNNGIILNSVHSTEGCYTYIKEINNGLSETQLSEDEKEALEKAIKEK